MLCGEVHDENCAALAGAGHAGLFGNADAVLDAAQGLLDGSAMPPITLDVMRTPVSARRTPGWEGCHLGCPGGDTCSNDTIGHTGFTGTGVWIDVDAGLAWTLLTHRVHPTRHSDSGIVALRRAVGAALTGPRSDTPSRQAHSERT